MTRLKNAGIAQVLIIAIVVTAVAGAAGGYGGAYVQFTPQISSLQSERDDATSEVTQLNAEADQLRSNLQEAITETGRLRANISTLQIQLQNATEFSTILRANLTSQLTLLQAKLDSIKATTPKLEKVSAFLKAWSAPFPESREGQSAWFQTLIASARDFDASVVPLLDKTLAARDNLVAWSDLQPIDPVTRVITDNIAWINWAIEWFRLLDIYLAASEEWSTQALKSIIISLEVTIQASK